MTADPSSVRPEVVIDELLLQQAQVAGDTVDGSASAQPALDHLAAPGDTP